MPLVPPRSGIVHSACPHDCPDTCSILSHVESGRLTRVEGNPEHPVTRGFLCRKLANAPERVYAKERLLHPMRRVGRGSEPRFERISWEEALEEITSRWTGIIGRRGPRGILPFFGSGTEGLVHGHLAGRRFFNRLGTRKLLRTTCTRAGRTGYRYTMGTSLGADPTRIRDMALVIDWGVNTASTNIHQQTFLREARSAGAEYAVINPVAIEGARSADHFIQPRPGSDAALALGMMNVIIGEQLHDAEFVSRHTHGFESLRARVRDYPPERVAQWTDVPADRLRSFARSYARLRPSFIYVGPGAQRHTGAGMALRTIACLPALVGAWRAPGGGVYFPTSTCFPGDFSGLEGDWLCPDEPAQYNMVQLADVLEEDDVESLYVFNGNPAATLFDQRKLRRQLARDDLFTIVHERVVTDTARHADILLPATSQFEQRDILFSYYHFGLLLNERAIEPRGECRSNLRVFQDLARRLGFDEPELHRSEEELIDEILALDQPAIRGLDREKLRRDGWAEAGEDPLVERFARHLYPTPSGRIELYSEQMTADGYDPLPSYEPGEESRERSPEVFDRHPLQLITPSSHSFHNSSHANVAGVRALERRPTLWLHPDDARPRGIEEGTSVRVFNARGEFRIAAHITRDLRAGVVAAAGQWWSACYADGANANHTTPDFLADMGGGPAFNTNLVQVARGDAPDD